ncbi:hypothetical protein [Haloarchaeobius sp. FL176]|uniref:hypothetical protein n=1 Tax=Haloarchaeobius sp. FL176 TaxID=2967129 RepID=UPI0021478D7B|nr:hypothetical protein [Haloarchaeobius sp. FL176]
MGMFSTYGDRIAAIALGGCLLVAYLLVNPFELTSDVVATGLSGIPVTLLIFGVAGVSQRSAIRIGGASTLGLMIGTYLQTAGIVG